MLRVEMASRLWTLILATRPLPLTSSATLVAFAEIVEPNGLKRTRIQQQPLYTDAVRPDKGARGDRGLRQIKEGLAECQHQMMIWNTDDHKTYHLTCTGCASISSV